MTPKEVAIEAESRAQNEEAEALLERRNVRNLNKIIEITRRLLDGCKFCQLLRCLY